MLNKETKKIILNAQRNEITEHFIYNNLALSKKNMVNSNLFKEIAGNELGHYDFWKKITGEEVKPDKYKIWKYGMIASVFGITFAIKLMETGEVSAQESYKMLSEVVPGIESIINDENKHENSLIVLVEEERLKYISSMVLGLNDALIELTGTLAGFSLVFQKTKIIAVAGLVTGIAAAFSMAGSEYLSIKSENDKSKSPLKASVYTGIVYFATVIVLILPYLVLKNPLICISIVLACAVMIIWIFTFYYSVAMGQSFRKRFFEMVIISAGVAALSFGVGYFVRVVFNIST